MESGGNTTTPAAIPPVFVCGRYRLSLDQPRLMGIVNVTPDSFSDGGKFFSSGALKVGRAIDHAKQLIDEGADILDVGGESTRPGAAPVSAKEELGRVMPVLEALMGLGVPISLDSRRPEVMQHAIDLGVDILNDINGFRDPQAFEKAARSSCGLCVMHMQGAPQTMQARPVYTEVVSEVHGFLLGQLKAFGAAGVDLARVLLDPGIGFGKTFDHNLSLMRSIGGLSRIHPVVLGVSRKSMIGEITGQKDPAQRVLGSVAAALWAAQQGVQVLRVHDVGKTKDALKTWLAMAGQAFNGPLSGRA